MNKITVKKMERENDLVLFRNYADPLIAQFHKALLEEYGIPCVIKDLGFNFPSSIFSPKTAGIKILVRSKDLQNANNLMSIEFDDDEFEDENGDDQEDDGELPEPEEFDFDDEEFDIDLDEDIDIDDLDFESDNPDLSHEDEDSDEDDTNRKEFDDMDISEGFEIEDEIHGIDLYPNDMSLDTDFDRIN